MHLEGLAGAQSFLWGNLGHIPLPSSVFLDTIPEDSKCLGVRTISLMSSCTTLAISHLCPYPAAAAVATAGLVNTKKRTPMLITSTVPNVAELSQLRSRTGDNRVLFFQTKIANPNLSIRQLCKSWPPAPLLAAPSSLSSMCVRGHMVSGTCGLYATITDHHTSHSVPMHVS